METDAAVAALGALAHETRLEIYRHLVRAGFSGATPTELGTTLHVPAPTLSFHLKELKHAGLVRCKREGRSLHYSADFGAMTGLLHYLTENCCQSDPAQDCCPADTGAAKLPEGTR